MHDMTFEGQAPATITPQACLPNLLPIATEWDRVWDEKQWWIETPCLGFYPIEFRQQWQYRRYVYVDVSDAILEHYRFIGKHVSTTDGVKDSDARDPYSIPGMKTGTLLDLERIVRIEWLHASGDDMLERAYRATRTSTGMITLTKATGTEEIPPWPEGEYQPPLDDTTWYKAVPNSLKRYLLPIHDNCSGNTLPSGFHQVTLQWKDSDYEYLYIDVPETELTSWALLGTMEKEWERGGISLLDVYEIQRLPLDHGEGRAHTLYREPATGTLGIRSLQPFNPDMLTRGQLVECVTDIDREMFYRKEGKTEYHLWAKKGETLIILRPGSTQDTYQVARLHDEYGNESSSLDSDVHRNQLRVLEGQFKLPYKDTQF